MRAKLVLVLTVAGISTFLSSFLAAHDVTIVMERKLYVQFLDDSSRNISLYLQREIEGDSVVSVITIIGDDGQTSVFREVGCRLTGQPIIIPATQNHGQLVLLTSEVGIGPGTGLGYFQWLVVGTQGRRVFVQNMGTWESSDVFLHPGSGYSQFFRLSLDPLRADPEGAPVFRFHYCYRKDNNCEDIEGSVLLRISMQGHKVTASLEPSDQRSARACVKLLGIDAFADPAGWAAGRLETLVPKSVREYYQARRSVHGNVLTEREATTVDKQILQTIGKAVEEYYAKDNG